MSTFSLEEVSKLQAQGNEARAPSSLCFFRSSLAGSWRAPSTCAPSQDSCPTTSALTRCGPTPLRELTLRRNAAGIAAFIKAVYVDRRYEGAPAQHAAAPQARTHCVTLARR